MTERPERAEPDLREPTAARPEGAVQERAERKEARFRAANEYISHVADEYGVDGLVPFICECADVSCTAIVRLSVAEYRGVRADPVRLLTVLGHEAAAGPGKRLE